MTRRRAATPRRKARSSAEQRRARWTAQEVLAGTSPWSEAQRAAWAAPIDPTPSDWCDEHRKLAGDGVLEPGQWKTSRTPYLREILDALAHDSPYTEVIVKKSARVGGTEVINCAISYLVDVAPDPILLVFPDQAKAEEEIRDRIEPMLKAQENTARYFTGRAWDVKNRRIKLSKCTIRVGWSRSASTLGGFQARYRFFDEVDKYGDPRNEADAVSLGDARGMQYGSRGKSYKTSTPTTPHGPINRLWEGCADRRQYHVPCPHCGVRQVLRFGRMRWEGSEGWEEIDREDMLAMAERVAVGDVPVHYACEGCNEPIRDRHKQAALEAGQWISEGCEPGVHPRSTSVAFHISALYSPWVTFGELVAEGLKLRARGRWRHFVNSWLGEVYEEQATELTPEIFLTRSEDAEHGKGVAPAWTRAIVAGVDVQQDHFWYVVRACGTTPVGGSRRRLLDWGRVETWDELRALLRQAWPVEGHPDIPHVGLRALAIDVGGGGKVRSGTRTDETYRFASEEPTQVLAVRGKGGDFNPDQVEPFSTAKSGKGRLRGVPTRLINTQYYKTKVAGLIRQEDVAWEEAPELTRDYARQMSAEHQVWRTRPNGVSFLWWQPKKAAAANHLWDASVYCESLADMLQVDQIRPVVDEHKVQLQRRRAELAARQEGGRWVETSGWSTGARGEGW